MLQGDTVDDLCRPEFEEELSELKELCEVVSPPPPHSHSLCLSVCQSASRNRCYAMNHKRPSLLHQNSRDEVNGGKPSPTGLRRRWAGRVGAGLRGLRCVH